MEFPLRLQGVMQLLELEVLFVGSPSLLSLLLERRELRAEPLQLPLQRCPGGQGLVEEPLELLRALAVLPLLPPAPRLALPTHGLEAPLEVRHLACGGTDLQLRRCECGLQLGDMCLRPQGGHGPGGLVPARRGLGGEVRAHRASRSRVGLYTHLNPHRRPSMGHAYCSAIGEARVSSLYGRRLQRRSGVRCAGGGICVVHHISGLRGHV
mmetsp:Transcript_131481/g.420677  ORF Transcript_131481/g.420677 Transcript_131481/m.420677 type:complete len:210 (+) Transcript_131481:2851-3480(+)